MKTSTKKDQLVEVAIEHFNRNGFHGTGIDRILEDTGIAKMTLYRHFPSKEDLIVEVLRVIDERFRRDMRKTVDRAETPREKLLATFDYLEEWFSSTTFYGCPFMAAAGEYSEPGNPVVQEASMHKRLMLAYFEELAKSAGYDKFRPIAEQINLLHEGATAIAHINSSFEPARLAKQLAEQVLSE